MAGTLSVPVRALASHVGVTAASSMARRTNWPINFSRRLVTGVREAAPHTSAPQVYCTVFRYATRSDICCGLLNRGQTIFACRMRVNICGPCFHSAEIIVISE